MTLNTLQEVLQPALQEGYAVAGLVVLGWEDARAFTEAAQAEGLPLILQAGPGCRAHTPLPVLASMFRTLAADVDVPVVAHLDHGRTLEECRAAIDAGFSSIMFDGSTRSYDENVELTARAVELARAGNVSCEGEIGHVGYAEGEPGALTDPDEAACFVRDTGVDALAVAVGNVHLQTAQQASIDRAALEAIETRSSLPLVIHGGSGVPAKVRRDLALHTAVCKFNIGTELRQCFGRSLREVLAKDPERFDRLAILADTMPPMCTLARSLMRNLAP